MADQTYTVEDYREAAQRAVDAGNFAAAEELAAAGIALQKSLGQEAKAEAKKDRGFLDMLRENIVGEGEVDTVGERVGEAITPAGAGALRGVRGLAELPEMAASLGKAGYQYVTGQEVEALPQETVAGSKINQAYTGLASALGADPSGIEFRGETGTGQFAGKVGEFLPFAGRQVAKYALAPVVAGMAGQKTAETLGYGETGQMVGELAGMVSGPAAFTSAGRAVSRGISPYGGADKARLASAEFLERKGVKTTAGQKIGSEGLRRKESMGPLGDTVRENQLSDFTAAVMKEVGSTSKTASADALEALEGKWGGAMNEVMRGVELRPDVTDLFGFSDAASYYRKVKPTGVDADQAGDLFARINKAAIRAAKSDRGFDMDEFQSFRRQLSKLTVSSDKGIKDSAIQALTVIDGMMDKTLTGLGRADDIKKLNEARSKYRDYLAIRDSVTKGGEAAAAGLITPSALGSAMRRQGSKSFVMERRGDLGKLAKTGEEVAVFPKQSGTGRDIKAFAGQMLRGGASGSAAGYIGTQFGIPFEVGAALGALGPITLERLMMTKSGQKYLVNQLVKTSGGAVDENLARSVVAGIAQQMPSQEQ